MRPIILLMMYNSFSEPISNHSIRIADSSLHATTKTRSLNRSIQDVLSSSLELKEKKNNKSLLNSSEDLTGSWTEKGFKVIRKYSLNSLTSIFQIGGAF